MNCQSVVLTERTYKYGYQIDLVSNILLAVSNMTANSTLLYSITKLKLSGRPTFKYCIWMCICNLLVSLVLQPLTGYVFAFSHDTCEVTDVALQSMAYGLYEFSGLMIAFIGIERYRLLRQRHNARENGSKQTTQGFIIFALIFCLLLVLLSVLSSVYMFLFEFQLAISAFNFSILITVTLMGIEGLYFLIITAGHINHQLTARVSRQVAILIAISVICCIPIYLVYPMYLYRKYKRKAEITRPMTSAMLLFTPFPIMNSILQAIMMIVSCKEIREYVKVILRQFSTCVRSNTVIDVA